MGFLQLHLLLLGDIKVHCKTDLRLLTLSLAFLDRLQELVINILDLVALDACEPVYLQLVSLDLICRYLHRILLESVFCPFSKVYHVSSPQLLTYHHTPIIVITDNCDINSNVTGIV